MNEKEDDFMTDRVMNKEKPTQKTEEKNQKPTYWERVIQGKGTVSEPWPTAKELWEDPEVKKAIEAHNQLVKKRNES